MRTTKQRILEFIDYQGISKQFFFRETGLKRGLLDADKIDSSISDIYLAKILATYPELNPEWLLTGQGDMLLGSPVAKLRASIPLIPIGAMAGWVGTFGAMQAVRVLLDGASSFGDPQFGKLHILDGMKPGMRTLNIAKDAACRGCRN